VEEARVAAKLACNDCGSTTRKLNQVSPKVLLCAEDIRKRKKVARERRQHARQQGVFGITLEQAKTIEEFQGGGCICAEWTGYNGATRALSTDHDHQTGEVRGRLCKHCNDLLGRVRDNPDYFRRMIAYLENPPARRLFGRIVVPGHIAEG
jgi:hypothetical protein